MSEASDIYIYPHAFSSRTLIASIHIYFNSSSSWCEFFLAWITHPLHVLCAHFFTINQELIEKATKITVCYMELLPSMPSNFSTYASMSTGVTRSQMNSLSHEYIWISQLVIEVQNLSKSQKILITNLYGMESLFKALSIIIFI